jgi:plasmid stabilization system protein ParE
VNRPAAPGAVEDSVRDALRLIRLNPQIGARATNVELPGVRRVHLSRIHYHLYYRILSAPRCIEVLALWHVRRGTGPGL